MNTAMKKAYCSARKWDQAQQFCPGSIQSPFTCNCVIEWPDPFILTHHGSAMAAPAADPLQHAHVARLEPNHAADLCFPDPSRSLGRVKSSSRIACTILRASIDVEMTSEALQVWNGSLARHCITFLTCPFGFREHVGGPYLGGGGGGIGGEAGHWEQVPRGYSLDGGL